MVRAVFLDFHAFSYTTRRRVVIWYVDPAVRRVVIWYVDPSPTYGVVQKYSQPSAGPAGGPPHALIPFGTVKAIHIYCTTTPAVHTTVMNSRANL